jgi:SPP1 family predicted phage head-tail adaptor
MRAGRMRNRLKVVKDSDKRNSFGEVEGKELVKEIWCEVNVKSSTDNNSNRTGNNTITEFKTRYNKSIINPTSDMFIIFKGCEYDITSVINYREENKHLIITATKRV